MRRPDGHPWFLVPRRLEGARLRLFCFHHAGGGASAYHAWGSALEPDVEVRAVQLPGRESRIREPALLRMEDAVAALVAALEPYLAAPFAFFGHSMGALVAHAVARELRSAGLGTPAVLCLSGCRPPHAPAAQRHLLPDAALVDSIRALGGFPDAVLAHPELMALVLPALRADLTLLETYAPGEHASLDVPIHVLGGREDVPEDDLRGWQRHTAHPVRVHMFDGGHFFLRAHEAALLAAMREILSRP